MAALVEGREYGLSSLESTSASKSVVHVKLTDSALKAIDEFQKIKATISHRPTIQLLGSNGVMCIPVRPTSQNGDTYREFHFSLSSIQADPNGSYDCVRQGGGVRSRDLELLGSMVHKMSVHATDDVYQATKEKMTLAEEEVKKSCAKEIKPSGPNIGRRVKKSAKHHGAARPAPGLGPRPQREPSTASAAPRSQPTSRVGGGRPAPPSAPPPVAPPRHALKVQPDHANSSVGPAVGARPAGSPSGARRGGAHASSYRDRVLHLLAIRPYKKPELLAKLHRDGVREKDKNSLTVLLKHLGVFAPRDNSYTLCKHLYAEVQPAWPGYSDDDRALLKRRMPQEASLSRASSPAISPVHSNSSQGGSPQSQKRPSSCSQEPDYAVKKQRTAHVKKEAGDGSWKTSPEKTTAKTSSSSSSSSSSSQPPSIHHEAAKTKPEASVKTETTKHVSSHRQKKLAETAGSPLNNQENDSGSAPWRDDTRDYERQYEKITLRSQRYAYKQNFNSQYEEYRLMYASIEKVTSVFEQLKQQLTGFPEGSTDYEKTKSRILSEYREVAKDVKFVERRQRCNYLHHKLAHIKRRIAEYDWRTARPAPPPPTPHT